LQHSMELKSNGSTTFCLLCVKYPMKLKNNYKSTSCCLSTHEPHGDSEMIRGCARPAPRVRPARTRQHAETGCGVYGDARPIPGWGLDVATLPGIGHLYCQRWHLQLKLNTKNSPQKHQLSSIARARPERSGALRLHLCCPPSLENTRKGRGTS
jgi:hypothetical protein